jgi:hypothetical protein
VAEVQFFGGNFLKILESLRQLAAINCKKVENVQFNDQVWSLGAILRKRMSVV